MINVARKITFFVFNAHEYILFPSIHKNYFEIKSIIIRFLDIDIGKLQFYVVFIDKTQERQIITEKTVTFYFTKIKNSP